MHPVVHAKTQPEHIAITMSATGETVSYRQLNERSNQAAHWFRNAFGDEVFEAIAEGQRKGTPMARAGSPQDTKGPILFFANRMSAHVTGQLMVVDAGMLLGMPFKIG